MTFERVFRLAQWKPRWNAVWYLLWAAFLFAFTSYETDDLWILVRGLIWIGFVSFLIARLFASARQRESEDPEKTA